MAAVGGAAGNGSRATGYFVCVGLVALLGPFLSGHLVAVPGLSSIILNFSNITAPLLLATDYQFHAMLSKA
ncbi:hypothetical protein CRG98_010330 [Punica granatum]|uniref:Uncharacterized protein n=1 Tax=Punica granatum TaxID=22663 RepID=A0A2I0KL71_PUNGR|nr:hypothetical protein CRG98_010330 [Punica granatum]